MISGAADPERARQAMAAVEERLVRPDGKLILLFDPPFDRGALRARLHQGLRAGHPRERRPVHARRHLGRAGDGAAGPRRPGRWSCWNLLNPVHHAATPADGGALQGRAVRRGCADVYGAPPHTGRGGWTWYTGSASWLYRVALEAILGFRLAGDTLRFEPCVPPGWPGYEITYRYGSATYRIRVENPAGTGRGVRSVTVDGQPVPGGMVPLRDDGRTHDVRVDAGLTREG